MGLGFDLERFAVEPRHGGGFCVSHLLSHIFKQPPGSTGQTCDWLLTDCVQGAGLSPRLCHKGLSHQSYQQTLLCWFYE